MEDSGKKYKRADLDNVEAFMGFVGALDDPEFRGRFISGEAPDEFPEDDKLAALLAFLRQQPEPQLEFLAQLVKRDGPLATAELYDEYNPRLYYL